MLTAEGCLARRQRLWNQVPADTEWILVADPRHVNYLCGFWINPFSFSATERGWLLLERDGSARLLADNFGYRSAVGEPHVDEVLAEKWYDHQHSVINRDHALLAALKSASARVNGRPGLVEAEWVPLAAAEILGPQVRGSFVPAPGSSLPATTAPGHPCSLGQLLRDMRRCKDADELELLRRAMRATDAGHARAREVVRAGLSEWDIYREVQSAVLEAVGEPAIVYGDFRAVSAAEPKRGGLPTQHVLADGEIFILDYSVVIAGYRSDFTNALAVGTPSPAQQELMDLCQAAMASGEQSLRAGTRARDVHAAVMAPFAAAGRGKEFPHHAGHGIGLGHPEPPILVPQSDDVLRAGDVVTLEPGLYVPGVGGIRIEHNYLVTETGSERLSHHTIALR